MNRAELNGIDDQGHVIHNSAIANVPSQSSPSPSPSPPPALLNRLPNPPTLIEHGSLRFVIMDAPTDTNIQLYIKELHRFGVSDMVRVCEPTYNKKYLEDAGIAVHDWVFPDGESPPADVVNDWLRLIDRKLLGKKNAEDGGGRKLSQDSNPCSSTIGTLAAIGCHCVAGLGRAPVLVAIALIEDGMSPLDAVSFIRERRRGAINSRQLRYLESYKPRNRRGNKLSSCLVS